MGEFFYSSLVRDDRILLVLDAGVQEINRLAVLSERGVTDREISAIFSRITEERYPEIEVLKRLTVSHYATELFIDFFDLEEDGEA